MASFSNENENFVNNPHDAAFRSAFQKKELATDFFRHNLPKEILKLIDFRTLKINRGSYVDEKLRDRHSDIVYRAKLRGKTSFLYILFEHQSTPDRRMAFRLLCYMINLWKEYFDQNPDAEHLPTIIPLVLYHGKAKWNVHRSLSGMFEADESLKKYIPDFAYELFNLSEYQDERILMGSTVTLGVVLYLMKHIFDDGFGERFVQALKYLGKIDNQKIQLEFLEWMLRYTYHARDDDREYIDRGLEVLGNEDARRMAMTIAERLRQEGMGIGRFELLQKLLNKRFGYLPPVIERKLSESGMDDLDRFGESIFEFKTLEDAEKWWEDYEKKGNA